MECSHKLQKLHKNKMKDKKINCEYCNDLPNKYCETVKETYKDGWIIRSDYKCKYCKRIVYEDIE